MTWMLVSCYGIYKGRHWEIGTVPLVLGRAVDCAIVIDDPSVSRRHCTLCQVNGEIHLQDMGSIHPPLVNGDEMVDGLLKAGDMVNIGRGSFVVTEGDMPSDVTPRNEVKDKTLDLFKLSSEPIGDDTTTTLHEGRPQSVTELVELFNLARRLSRATSRADLSAQVLAHLAEADGLPHAAIALVANQDSRVYWAPDLAESDPAFSTVLAQVTEKKKGLILWVQHGEGGEKRRDAIMAAPLVAGGTCYGALISRPPHGHLAFGEGNLNRLLSVAQMVAPYYKTVAHVARLENTVAQLDDRAGERGPLVGKSRALRSVRTLIRDIAPTELNILLTGETGTGKEIAAKMIHEGSPRAKGPYIAINCAALPDQLFESEMFGHEKGAFTNADKKRKGRFALADGGTLFLDEIGELSLENQARLLRVLESGQFNPVGSEVESHVDVRVVAATNRDLKRAIKDGRFRRDLYHRLCSVEIALPALRQRPSDIPLLAQHFAHELTSAKNGDQPSLTDDALAYLQALPWTGNVRELRNAIERATALAKAPQITPRDFTFLNGLLDSNPDSDLDDPNGDTHQTLAEVERNHITHVLEQCNYNVSKAAKILGVHRNTLHNKIAAYGIGG